MVPLISNVADVVVAGVRDAVAAVGAASAAEPRLPPPDSPNPPLEIEEVRTHSTALLQWEPPTYNFDVWFAYFRGYVRIAIPTD